MGFRLRVPRLRGVVRSRRLVVALAVVALLAGAGVSSASAASGAPSAADLAQCEGQTPPVTDSQVALCLSLLALARASATSDFDSRDARVAAPSSVIAATSSETPTRRVQEVTRWRPNPQAWIDAKSRLSAPTGVTTANWEAQVASTARWQPRLTPLRALGVVGVLSTGAEVAWEIRDGYLYPALGLSSTTTEDTFCTRRANVVTDFFGGLVSADCAEWRLGTDPSVLVGAATFAPSELLVPGGGFIRFVKRVALGNDFINCYALSSATVSAPSGLRFRLVQTAPSGVGVPTLNHDRYWGQCNALATYPAYTYSADPNWQLYNPATSEVVASTSSEVVREQAEWFTRVRCLDGSTRVAVSESYQQESLGAVVEPAAVQLAGCQPVGVDLAKQKKGLGTSGAGSSPFPTTPGGDRLGADTAEVPTEVQDWMRDYPSCWDGSCLLELRKVIGGALELDCFNAPEQCSDWQTEVAADPSTYRCYYGNVLQSIAECNVYGRTFVREAVQQGTAYSDPATGQPVTTSTGTAVTTNPGAASTAMSSPAADPGSSRQCWPTGWGAFNPFEWVFQPVKCALEWAFVPRATKLSQVQTKIQLAAVNSAPAQMVQGLNGWTAAVPSSSGCMGPLIQFDVAGLNYSAYPLQACDGPLSTAANFSRIALTIIAILTGIIAITRYVARIFGFSGVGEGGSA